MIFYFSNGFLNERIKPTLEEVTKKVTEEFQGKVRVGRVEYFDNKRLSRRFNVWYAPTIFLYKYKQEAIYFNGAHTADAMMDFIRENVKLNVF